MEATSDVIHQIDTLRYQSPSEARKLALDVLSHGELPPEIAPGFFGAFGSALRMSNDLTGAERAIHWGLQRVDEDPFTEARLYQRLAVVRENRRDFPAALECSKKAAVCFQIAEAYEWIPTTLFTQGRILFECDQYEESLDLLLTAEAAKAGVSEDLLDNWQGSVLSQTALAYGSVGKPEEGLKWLRRSREYPMSPWLAIRQTWTEARLRASLEDFTKAQELLSQVIDFFEGVHPVETALARVELAECHLQAGQVKEGRSLIRDVYRTIPTIT